MIKIVAMSILWFVVYLIGCALMKSIIRIYEKSPHYDGFFQWTVDEAELAIVIWPLLLVLGVPVYLCILGCSWFVKTASNKITSVIAPDVDVEE